jgi:virginiamycin B lyase
MRQRSKWLAVLALVAVGPVALAASQAVRSGVGATEPRVTEFAIPGAQAPRDPWPHSAGGVYFSMRGADKIVRFDASTRQFKEWALPAGAKPHGVAVGSDGRIFYAGFGDGTIGELDPRTGVVRQHRLTPADSRPYSIALDNQGNVWATARAGWIAMLDRSTGRVTEHRMDGEPYSLAFDRSGVLWVTCIGSNKLHSFNPQTGRTTELAFEPGSKPRRLSIAADGKIWVSLYGAGRLAAVDGATNKVVKQYMMPGGPNSGPYSVSVGPGGRVWVTEFQTDTIAVLDPSSGTFRVIPLAARSGIRNAAMDALGRYWFIYTATGKIGLVE